MPVDYVSVPPRLGTRGPRPRPIADRFWEKVLFGDGCWIWEGPLDSKGYGLISFGSQTDGSKHKKAAHRAAYEMKYGPVPQHLNCCHKCDNPKCVRPDHLFIGTQKENLVDMARKGRHNAKLTAAQVRAIRARWRPGYGNLVALAREYRVRPSVISHVVHGWSWRHLP